MLDPAYVRDHQEEVKRGLESRGLSFDRELEQLAALENRRRRLIPELEGLKREQNAAGEEVARAKRQGEDASRDLRGEPPAGSADPTARASSSIRWSLSARPC